MVLKNMIKIKKKSKGFTLIEVIATIFIIAIIATITGTIIIKTITKSKDESAKIAKNNILNSARIYTKEYSDEISWKENKTTKFSCISISELINKNLLKKDIKYKDAKYILIKKDKNDNIISENFDDGTCNNSIQSIKIPTSKEFCSNNLTYNGTQQTLTTSNQTIGFDFKDNIGEDAGTYTITASLKDNFQWTDGTTEDKNFSCTIKKDTPTIALEPNGIDSKKLTTGEIVNIKVISNTNGTIILKSSNNDYYESSIISNEVDKKKSFNIKFLSTRIAEGTITVTLIPEDKKNYNNSSTILTIGNTTKKEIEIPKCIENIYYDGEEKQLVESNDAVNFYYYKATNYGIHTVEARLKYGYIWKDNTTEPKTINCEIKRPTFKICYNDNIGTETTKCDDVLYKDNYTIKSNNFSNSNYTFTAWNTMSNGHGDTFNPGQSIEYNFLGNTTLYAQWVENRYNISYNLNGGTIGQKAPNTAKYDEIIQISNPIKKYTITYNDNSTGATIETKKPEVFYGFNGWTAENLNIDTAKYGSSNTYFADWNNQTRQITNTYFKNLGANDTTVTLIANWSPRATTLPQITKIGYKCKWNTQSNGNGTSYDPRSTYTPTSNITLYAICTSNKIIINYNTYGGTISTINGYSANNEIVYKNNIPYTTTLNYDEQLEGNGLTDYNSNANLKITRKGHSVPTGAEWICLEGCTTPKRTFSQSSNTEETMYSHNEFCDATNADCEVVLGVNWIKNKVSINYNPYGGIVEPSTNGGTWKVVDDMIYKNDSLLTTTVEYYGKLDSNGLIDYYSGENLKITRMGHSVKNGEEWVCISGDCLPGKVYSHAISYDASDFCDTTYADCEVVLGVNWQANNYTVTFDSNGGSVSPNNKLVTYNSTYETLPVPTKTGYKFNGWYTAISDGNKIEDSTKVTIASNHKLYAHWTPNKIFVKFHTNGGTITGTNNSYDQNSGIVLVNGNEIAKTYNYGATIDLLNYNNTEHLHITKASGNINYYVNDHKEWNTTADGTGTSFSQSGNIHNANELCDASNSDCTITLYVNWKIDTINGTRYNCSNYNGTNRLSVLNITTCNPTYCNFSKLNGLTSSNINDTVFTPPWTVLRNSLGQAIGDSACKTTTLYVRADSGLNCRSGASLDATRITGYANCTGIQVSQTTTKVNNTDNYYWFYFPGENCYLSGSYLNENKCISPTKPNKPDSEPKICGFCNSNADCGSDMTCNSNCGAGYSCCVKKVNQSTGIMCN